MNSNLIQIILLVISSTILGSIGSLFFKLSANNLKDLNQVLSQKFVQFFLFGATSFTLSVIIYTFTLSKTELSFLFPFISLSYIWTNLLSIKILKEKVSKKAWLGIILICIGVIIISYSG